LSRLATSFILGYHGCDRTIAERAIAGDLSLLQSKRDYDWLGPGSYFWEADPRRALEWAGWRVGRGDFAEAAVVGAVIDLGNCLDLASRDDVEVVRAAHKSFVKTQRKAGLAVPRNRAVVGRPRNDRSLRFLDCAVIRHVHSIVEASGLPPFDSVRALFLEGGRLYAGSGFRRWNHVQVAVINPTCIKGVFRPPG
jgi:hypothetical protein